MEGKFKTFSQTGIWGLGSGGRQLYPTAHVPDVFRKPHPEDSTTPPTTFSEPGVAGNLLGSQEQPWFGSGVSRATVVGSGVSGSRVWGLKSNRGRRTSGVSRATMVGELLGQGSGIGGGGCPFSEGALRILRVGGPIGSR